MNEIKDAILTPAGMITLPWALFGALIFLILIIGKLGDIGGVGKWRWFGMCPCGDYEWEADSDTFYGPNSLFPRCGYDLSGDWLHGYLKRKFEKRRFISTGLWYVPWTWFMGFGNT